jgi:nuclear pore complex protein Nup160
MWSRLWVYGPYINLNQDWDGFTGHILAFLIKDRHLELATEFQKFLTPSENASGWVKYLVGRLLLATGDYALASLQFRAAADDMAEATHLGGTDSAYLLSAEERNYFGVGHASFYQHVTALYEKLMVFSYTADFAALALKHLKADFDQARRSKGARPAPGATDSPEVRMIDDVTHEIGYHLTALPMRDELAGRLFNALVQTGRFRGAFDALNEIDNLNVKKANLRELVEKCVKQDAIPDLLALPFEDANLVQEADAILYTLAKKSLASGSTGSPPYYQILYSFRTQRSDFRGAAVILYEHLERLSYTQRKHGIQDMEDETLIEAYVLLINTLACCGQQDAWLLADPIVEVHGEGKKRRLVTIDEVRKEYGAELDRRSDILQGRFPLVAGDEMDVF